MPITPYDGQTYASIKGMKKGLSKNELRSLALDLRKEVIFYNKSRSLFYLSNY